MSTFLEMKTELSDRGFAHLSATRRGQIINDAIAELEELHLWPFREDSAQGAAPLSIPTLGVIEAVTNETSGQVLEFRSYQWLLDWTDDLTTAGVGQFFYVSWPAGDPVVNTYPDNSDTIGVQFWAVSSELAADADLPLTPERYHPVILSIAQRMAESERGNLQAAQALQAEIDLKVGRMVNTLLGGQQRFGPDLMRSQGQSEDW